MDELPAGSYIAQVRCRADEMPNPIIRLRSVGRSIDLARLLATEKDQLHLELIIHSRLCKLALFRSLW